MSESLEMLEIIGGTKKADVTNSFSYGNKIELSVKTRTGEKRMVIIEIKKLERNEISPWDFKGVVYKSTPPHKVGTGSLSINENVITGGWMYIL